MPAHAPVVQNLGATEDWRVTARDSSGAALTNLFVAGDTLLAQVSAGEDQPALFAPTATWLDAPGGVANVRITAAQLAAANVSEGLYALLVRAPSPSFDPGQPHDIFDGTIYFEATVGAAAAPTAYVTAASLDRFAPEIARLQSARSDLTNFAGQRGEARQETDRRILAAYRPDPGRTRRMYNAGKTATGPYGPYYLTAADRANPTYDAPTQTQVRTWLAADRLVVDAAVAEFNARWTAALVYGSQPGANNAYQQLAVSEYAKAEAAWARAIIELDTVSTPPTTTPTLRIDREATWLV
jgi:hypothetical protein